MMNIIRFSQICLAAISLAYFAGGCKEEVQVLQSSWGRSELEGKSSLLDRTRPMIYLDDQRMNIGIQNDKDNLYLILRSSDRDVQNRVRHGGFTVWFDSTGGINKILGIRFPLGGGHPPMISRPNDKNKYKSKGKAVHPDSSEIKREEAFKADTLVNLDTLGIFYGRTSRNYLVNDISSIAVSLTDTMGTMIYELRVPLIKFGDSSIAIGSAQGKTIGLGISSGGGFMNELAPKDSLEKEPPSAEPGGFGADQMGYGGGARPPRAEPRRGGQPVEFWIKVELAQAETK